MTNNIVFLRTIAKFIDLIVVLILWKIFREVGIFLGIFYLLISDGLFKGCSIGKKLLRLRVINIERQKNADFRDSIIRNLSLAFSLFFLSIPVIGWLICLIIFLFEFIIMIGDSESKRLGDYLAKTSVIEE
ncbi:MAG: RDD family protein [Thermodesulfovibrio sp.]|nr:RDD family protein [Thermodesulfovibrio sp.]MCX7724451.1 RDD family protein [Thermodesulfovibrio sp.]MDW7972176.1 RDD family protein [Thermodesulfovibrio sp.]